ncbi:hypothetical protein BJY52DRAFT_1192324 [Lactarius psammicola]|nr:hypothetical protein BJY52DRAFT_1192324 [Lactarius psammicola]
MEQDKHTLSPPLDDPGTYTLAVDPQPLTNLSPSMSPTDMRRLAHIKTFTEPPPSQPYHAIMDAGYDPNSQGTGLRGAPTPEHPSQQQDAPEVVPYGWLLGSTPFLSSANPELAGRSQDGQAALPGIEVLDPLPPLSLELIVSTIVYMQPSIQELQAPQAQRAGLSENTRRFIREAMANLRAIRRVKVPNCLPETTRRIIRNAVAESRMALDMPPAPEVIFVRSSTEPCDVVIPPSRPDSVASVWTHVTHESLDSDANEEFRTSFPEIHIKDFVESITDALRAPVLTEMAILPENRR